jgi:hypothetical protein
MVFALIGEMPRVVWWPVYNVAVLARIYNKWQNSLIRLWLFVSLDVA